MAIRIIPFGAFEGFSDLAIAGSHYYSQGFSPSQFGMATMYSIVNKIDSGTVSGMGNIKNFALANGSMYAQDDAGNILKETNPGAYDFSIVHVPSSAGTGMGLMADQYGNLFYANGASNNLLGKLTSGSYADSYQGFNYSGQHPMDTYEDLRLFGDGNNVALLDASSVWNGSAFTLPSSMTIVALKSGPTGILIGANIGYRSAVILWDGNALRAKTPWKWFKGQILSIELYGDVWLVKTQRGLYETNGYTVKQIFGVFDDSLSFKGYDSVNFLPQQMTVVNDTLIFAITSLNTFQSYQYGKMKPGIYLYSLSRRAWNYISVATSNTINLDIYSIFTDVNFNNRILIGYRDKTLGVNYIAALTNTPPTKAQLISEVIGSGRPHAQRIYFGPTDKTAEASVLNLQPLNSQTDPATLSFSVALKVYNFKRQLWGHATTNAALGSSHKDQLRVDGTSSSNFDAQVGDEVTILEGVNAGQISHIASIANNGASNETWTLDTTLPSATETAIRVQVEPFVLVKKQTFANLTSLKNIFWSIDSIKAKQFLAKFVFEGGGTNLALELMTSYFVFNDLGYDQT